MELVRYRRGGGLRILGHPAHAVLVHLPTGLLPASTLWDALAVAGLGGDEGVFWRVSFWTLVAGLVAVIPAAATGFADFAGLVQGRASERTGDLAVYHLAAMLAAASAYGGSLLARGGPSPPEGTRLVWTLVLAGTGLLLLAVGGWIGGELVYGRGVGAHRAPEPADLRPPEGPR